MKNRLRACIWVLVAICAGSNVSICPVWGDNFTYQGNLVKDGAPIGSPSPVSCAMTFGLFTQSSGGSSIGNSPFGPVSVMVTDGLFTTTLDFGSDSIAPLNGNYMYLEITVQCPGDVSATTLTPRQYLSPVPFAYALPYLTTTNNKSIVGGDQNNYLADGVNGATISGGGYGYVTSSYTPTCTGGTNDGNQCGDCYLGITFHHESCSSQFCTGFGANCQVDPNECPDGVCDAPGMNSALASYATVSGGWGNSAGANYSSVGGGEKNRATGISSIVNGGSSGRATGDYSTVGGGAQNQATASYATIGGGLDNYATASKSTVGGGSGNEAGGVDSVVGGGVNNDASGSVSTVAGGSTNNAAGDYSMVAGGQNSLAGGNYSFAAGRRAKVRDAATIGDADGDEGTFVWADSTNADFTSTGPNQFLIRTSGGVGINTNSPVNALDVEGSVAIGAAYSGINTAPVNGLIVEGSVGFGTASPSAELHVRAADDICELRMTPNASEQHSQIYLAETPGGSYATILRHDGASNIFRIRGVNSGTESGDHLTIARSSGRVGVGRTSSANALEVEGDASKTTAGSWLANSDAAIKENVSPLTNALDVIDKLRPVAFQYTQSYRKEHPFIAKKTYYNYIAQEFREVFPDWVQNSGEQNLLQMDSYPASVYSVAAIQELHQIVNEKDCELQSLKDEIAELKSMMNTLMEKTGGSP